MFYNPVVAHARAGTSVKYSVKTTWDRWFPAAYGDPTKAVYNLVVSPDGVEVVRA